MKTIKKQGLNPTMTIKNEKVNEFVYILPNGKELTFKDKVFPISQNCGQTKLFI